MRSWKVTDKKLMENVIFDPFKNLFELVLHLVHVAASEQLSQLAKSEQA